jgi:hypothetical protein
METDIHDEISRVCGGNPAAEFTIGIVDCIFGLGVALANAGVITRDEIAAAFESVHAQQQAMHPARQNASKSLAMMFRLPTWGEKLS